MRKSHNKALSFLFVAGVIPVVLCGQGNNPADRYLNAHKQYLSATCPVEEDGIKHFVYFARDRDQLHDHPFLHHERFEGAQIMYSWKQLEPEKGHYDFSIVKADYEYLQSFGKKLFIQLQDATFNPEYKGVPDYLLTDEYDGGALLKRSDEGEPEGWVAKRWNLKVQKRFALLLMELGREFDGRIEGINLQETAIGVGKENETAFSPESYAAAILTNMSSLKRAFPQSTTMQYANFMPGEWLPWEDHGYLRSVYEHGEKIEVGLGGPDLMVRRKPQLNHALAMMHESEYSVPLGIAIQDGNYVGMTGADKNYNEQEDRKVSGHKNIVPLLHAFAKDFLRVSYMFWVIQEPYFSSDVLPCLSLQK